MLDPPQTDFDWLAEMDFFFNLCEMPMDCSVWFPRMQLQGSVEVYWTSVERQLENTRNL